LLVFIVPYFILAFQILYEAVKYLIGKRKQLELIERFSRVATDTRNQIICHLEDEVNCYYSNLVPTKTIPNEVSISSDCQFCPNSILAL
jgi:hypothetical protein